MQSPRNIALLIAALALGALFYWNAFSPSKADELNAAFDAFLKTKEKEGYAGGVMVVQGDQIIFQKAYGSASCSGDDPMTPEHLFMVGSIVKMFTKIGVFKLQDLGLMDFNDSLAKHLPGVPEDKKDITIFHLLRHQSGLPDFVNERGETINNNFANLRGEEEVDWDYVPTTREEITERGLKAELLFEPGTEERYSNLGFALLASLIVELSGQDYEAFIRENVFLPAGMTQTGSVLPDWQGLAITEGCAGDKPWPMPYFIGRWMADGPSWNNRGNGGMMGTTDNLLKFVNGIRDNVYFENEAVNQAYRDHQIGTSGRFKERAAAAFGGNGIYNAYYYWLAENDIKLISFSTKAEHNGENYLGDFLDFLEVYLSSSANPN